MLQFAWGEAQPEKAGSWVRRFLTAVLIAALLSPAVRNHDSLPLSTYPMYSGTRSNLSGFVTASGIDVSGDRATLSDLTISGSRDPLIAQSFLNDAVQRGDSSVVCSEIVSRVDRTLAGVEIAIERHDTIARLQDAESLLDRDVLASCEVSIVPQGGNTGLVGGSVPLSGELVVSTERLTEVEKVAPHAGDLTVGAGTRLAQVQRIANTHGWDYGVDIGSRDSATIGGTRATRSRAQRPSGDSFRQSSQLKSSSRPAPALAIPGNAHRGDRDRRCSAQARCRSSAGNVG